MMSAIPARHEIDSSVYLLPKHESSDYAWMVVAGLSALMLISLGPPCLISSRCFEAEFLSQAASDVNCMSFLVLIVSLGLILCTLAIAFLAEKKKPISRQYPEQCWGTFFTVAALVAGVGCIGFATLIQNSQGMQVLIQHPTTSVTLCSAYLDTILVAGIALTTLSALALWRSNKTNPDRRAIALTRPIGDL